MGGLSYAAVTLAPDSVGTRELRNGAVTPKKLSVTVGGADTSASGDIVLPPQSCGSGRCAPPTLKQLSASSIKLNRSGTVLAIISAEIDEPTATEPSAELQITATWDGAKGSSATREVALTGDTTQLVVPIPARLASGRHRLQVLVATGAATPVTLKNANTAVLTIH